MSDVRKVLAHRWQDAINLLLGIWLIVSPWALLEAATGAAAVNAWVLGVIIVVAAASALVAFHRWEEWASVLFGVWLIVSPWILGFGALMPAVVNQIVVGVLVGGLALWQAYRTRGDAAQTA